jgi:hypothetical protein
VAANERMLMYRTAKFWVLASMGVFFIIFFLFAMTVGTIMGDGVPGEFLLEGTDAYLAFYFFGYVQVILIIFVAVDFRKLEEKWRLHEVMLSKPMTTANWVTGKYLGVVTSILYLNLFLMILAAIGRFIKFLVIGSGFNVLPFIKYFAIATFPSILFMIALVFFLVSLVRVQVIAMLLAAGYVAGLWFYVHHKFYGLLDYGSFFASIFYSDLIGFGDIQSLLWQRLFFVLLTVVLISLSILLYPRLSQSKVSKRMTWAVLALFAVVSGVVGYSIVEKNRSQQQIRLADLEEQKKWISEPVCRVEHYDFDIIHGERESLLQVKVKMAVHNANQAPLDSLLFSLNGKLSVEKVNRHDGESIEFTQRNQLIFLNLAGNPLLPSETDTIRIQYAGDIDAVGFQLDRLPNLKGLIDKSDGPWIQPSISAWLSEDFAVLPAECGWYPVPGVAAGHPYYSPKPKNFSTATLRVVTNENLRVVSQGVAEATPLDDGKAETTIRVKSPVQGLSLNIGEYQLLSHQFKQTTLDFYYQKNHLLDYDVFAEVADTCLAAVERMLEIFEEICGVPYPYERLALVEAPLHMQVFVDRHGVDNVLLQPGVIMVDEVSLASNRLASKVKKSTKRARRRGQDDSPIRVKRDVFIEMVLDYFLPDNIWRRDGSISSPMGNYVHFNLDIADPVLARALELQLHEEADRRLHDTFYPDRREISFSANDRMRQRDNDWMVRRIYGIEIDSLVSGLLQKPLSQLTPESDGVFYRAAIDFKAPPVLQMLSERITPENYANALRNLLDEYRYQRVGRTDYLKMIQTSIKDIPPDFFAEWFDQATLPGYRITKAEAEKIDTGQMKIVYQVSTRVLNGEKGAGFVRLVCDTNKDKILRSVELGSYQEKEIQFAVPDEPQTVQVLPYFSRNSGNIRKQVSITNRISRRAAVDTSFAVTSIEDSLSIIVDDQDKGFFTPVSSEQRFLRPPSKGRSWWEWSSSLAYGKYYFGLHAKRGGRGEYPARWETAVPRDGDYELNFFVKIGSRWWQRNISQKFKIYVTSADGTFPIELRPQNTSDGWFPLGRFRLSKEDPAVVELSDEGNGYIIADAIRWEFVE